MKKILIVILVLSCLLCSACGGAGADIYDSLSPPKPSGELYKIQQALEDAVDSKMRLVYPSSGDYRSAIITEDITGDGSFEAFAFYSTATDDKSTLMHINYIKKMDGKWESVTDIQVAASGVESVEFAKLDSGDVPKLIVNWSRFSSLEKQLSVYSVDSGVLTEVTSAPFSTYSTCDFDGDGISEIVAVYMDAENKTATATLMSLTEHGFAANSVCKADPFVTAYSTPRITKFTNGTAALFIDAEKSSGTVTEIFYMKKGVLINAVGNATTGENIKTLRASQAKCQDFNGDGCLDIPLTTKLPDVPGTEQTDSVYMTIWCAFDGKTVTSLKCAVINYSDGYHMVIPDSWVNNFTVQRNIQYRERIMYRWDSEVGNTGEEIMRIEAVLLSDWASKVEHYAQYSEISRSNKYVYAVKFSNSALTPDLETVRKNFTVISDLTKSQER